MNQIVTYGFFGEDAAQRNFLSIYLTQQYPHQFAESEQFGWRIKATNKDQVDGRLAGALLVRRDLQLDMLFIGRDTDSADEKSIQMCRERLEKGCKGQHPVVFMIPVQCVEHWLWYLKRRQEKSGVNKLLETFKRTDAKKAVYGETLKVDKQLEVASQLLANFDADWLEQRSESFKHFHQQVKKYVTDNYKITPS